MQATGVYIMWGGGVGMAAGEIMKVQGKNDEGEWQRRNCIENGLKCLKTAPF